MKKEAYAESTIVAVGKRLRHLERNCNLADSEHVKGYVASKTCSMAFKESLVETYDIYCRANGITWNKPFYERYDKQPRIPTEEKLNMIIADCSRRLGLALSIIKDLGLRPIELTWLKVRDVDSENEIVTVTSAKHCVGRTLKLKNSTLAMLRTYLTSKNLGLNDRLFPIKSCSLSEHYRIVRNRLSQKLQDPSMKTIRLYDFRHFRASMEYHRTKDLLYVKKLLGHKDLRTTLRYIQLIESENDEFHSATAKTIDEAKALIEQGFEYVTEIDGTKLLRKRK